MNSDCPPLADHLLAPSGGLVYHLRALRHRHGLWAPFQRVVADWLAGWQPGRRELVIVGPSAGYALPAGFLRRFERVTALEPDPLARPRRGEGDAPARLAARLGLTKAAAKKRLEEPAH